MFNKLKTKHLTITFFVLLALVIFTNLGSGEKASHSFKSELTFIDTATVTGITVFPKEGRNSFSFAKKSNNWLVKNDEGEFNADNRQVESMLTSLSALKAKRLAAKNEDKWGKYEVTDSSAVRVELKAGENELLDIYIGKFSYSQPPQAANPYQRQQGTMTTFVRLNGEDEVYAVDGFLSMTFGRQVADYRDSKIVQVQKDSLARITIKQPGQTVDLTKNDSIWMLKGLAVDSTAITDYLSGMDFLRSTDYLPNDKSPVGNPTHSVDIIDYKGTQLAKVDAFYKDSTSIIISSSANPGTYFDGTKGGLFEKLFKRESDFVGGE